MSAAPGVAASSGRQVAEPPDLNRFLVCVIAFLRAKQLDGGARPRVVDDRHKASHLAVLEVLADTVSWNTA